MCHLFSQDEKKRSGNAAAADLPRHPLPLHRRHLRRLHLHPPPRPLLRQAHHTHPAAVGVAPEVAVSVFLKTLVLLISL